MIRWIGKCLCVLSALAVTDTHLMLAQGYAWGKMLQDRAPERGVAEALESTFNGAEPCPMCCAVQQQQREQQQEAPVPEADATVKWIPVTALAGLSLFPPVVLHSKRPPLRGWYGIVRKDLPSLPPPQCLG